MHAWLCTLAPFLWSAPAPVASPTSAAADVVQTLYDGALAKAGEIATAALQRDPRDDATRFALGVARLLRGVERLAQALHKYGVGASRTRQALGVLALAGGGSLPDLPVPDNPRPQRITYDELRHVGEALLADVARAEQTLAAITDERVQLPLAIGRVRMDFDADGKSGEEETFWRVYARLNRLAGVSEADAAAFVIAFDRADVEWLRGYCHLLLAIGEFTLAYDHTELFERTAHLLFPNVESPHGWLPGATPLFEMGSTDIVDLIAYVHLINFPVREPARSKAALDHLERMIAHSRQMWRCSITETDDDREWIPNPKQTGVIPGVRVTQEIVDGWLAFLDEAGALLEGKRLIPFWRSADGAGVNLRRVLTDPRTLDLVLWVQGTAATPYLERGELTRPETWERLQRVFAGEFIGFALWFN